MAGIIPKPLLPKTISIPPSNPVLTTQAISSGNISQICFFIDINDPFTIEDVAQSIADKLIRRHPHVFSDAAVQDSAEVVHNWEAIKKLEKGRTSALDGVAMSQPALALIEKLLYRASKFDVDVVVPEVVDLEKPADESAVGQALLTVIAWAHANGVDAESALRKEAMRLSQQIAAIEAR